VGQFFGRRDDLVEQFALLKRRVERWLISIIRS
jgi:hypothetical protein